MTNTDPPNAGPRELNRAAPSQPVAMGAARPGRRELLTLLLIIVLAVVARFIGLSDQSLWADEAATVEYAGYSFDTLLTGGFSPGNPSGYYLLVKAWIAVFGPGELGLRFFSIIAGVATIPAVWALGRRTTGNGTVGLAAALWLALAPSHVHFSQEVRAYSLVILLCVVSTHALINVLTRGGWRRWGGYVALASFMPYAHLQGFVVLLAQGVAACLHYAWRRPTRSEFGRFVLAEASLALLALCSFALYFAPSFLRSGGYDYWQGHVSLERFATLISLYVCGTGWLHLLNDRRELAIVIGAIVVLLGPTLPWLFARCTRRRHDRPTMRILLTILYVGPAAFILCCMFKPVWQSKYLLAFQPIYLSTLAVGLLLLRGSHRRRSIAAIVFAAAFLLPGLIQSYRQPWRPAYREMATHLADANPNGEATVYVYKFTHQALRHYYPHDNVRWLTECEPFVERVLRDGADGRRLYVVLGWSQTSADWTPIVRPIANKLNVRRRTDFRGLTVFEIGSDAPAAPPPSQ